MNWISEIDFRRWAIANFIVLALFGVVLRYLGCFSAGALNYINILHAHSHFAFAGWIFMALVILIAKQLDLNKSTINWLNLSTLICSFGMLISFSIEGYKFTSIAFSTLFLLVTYWFGYLVYTHRKARSEKIIAGMLIRSSIIYLVLSSIGPLALGALKATGNTGIIYQNAIYSYLHFQLNGWMLFAALGLLAGSVLNVSAVLQKSIKPWLMIFILSALPLFFIFTLWSKPTLWVFLLAFAGAFFNALSWFIIIFKLRNSVESIPLLVRFALVAVSLKVLFQLIICVPQIGEWAFLNRNLIIGYVHLISLGCVTPVLVWKFAQFSGTEVMRNLTISYCLLTIMYLATLFLQPLLLIYGITVPYFQFSLLLVSVLYCGWGISFYRRLFVVRSELGNK